MFKDVASLGNAILVLLGAVSLLAALYVAFRASFSTARIKALREDNEDLRLRVDDLDKEVVRRKAKEEALAARVKHVEDEKELLKEMVLQRGDFSRILTVMELHEEFVRTEIEVIKGMLREAVDG